MKSIIKKILLKFNVIPVLLFTNFCRFIFVLSKWWIVAIILVSFIYVETSTAYAEETLITAKELYNSLLWSNNNYRVFEVMGYTLPSEIYPSRCSLEIVVPQRYDSYCLDPKIIHQHWSGLRPAHECCQKYGIDWHRSHVIYLKNNDLNKPNYPGWEEAFLNPNINPDFLPVPQNDRWGFSDWYRGGSTYQWLLYNDARDLVEWVDSGRFQYAFNFVNSNIDTLASQDSIYLEFLKRVRNGEFLSAVEDARNFLNEIKVKGIIIETPIASVSPKECTTCK